MEQPISDETRLDVGDHIAPKSTSYPRFPEDESQPDQNQDNCDYQADDAKQNDYYLKEEVTKHVEED